jgi:hypothetical protein
VKLANPRFVAILLPIITQINSLRERERELHVFMDGEEVV